MKINLTPAHKDRVLERIRSLNLTNDYVASVVGKSAPWVTQLVKPVSEGGMQTLKADLVDKLELLLDFSFAMVHNRNSGFSESAEKMAEMVDESPAMMELAKVLIKNHESYHGRPRFIPTQEMRDIGKQIHALATELPKDSNGDYNFGKLARQVLELLA